MSNARYIYSFFQDESNRSIALTASDNLLNSLFNFVSGYCNLTLTPASANCTVPAMITGAFEVTNCIIQSNIQKQVIVATCDNSTIFSNVTKQGFLKSVLLTADMMGAVSCDKEILAKCILVVAGVLLLAGLPIVGYYLRGGGYTQIPDSQLESAPLTQQRL